MGLWRPIKTFQQKWDCIVQERPLSETEVTQRQHNDFYLLQAVSRGDQVSRQKARDRWIQEGDENTKYFPLRIRASKIY
uniref:Uncharacterized protein n=1 Tax=Utricularia reniformis TaxID=192314 RepID=A0A1Y0AZX2_9LAMI|nr:hypothetical protein AEK19_MT0475 [Utricularia reniformis]ART30732.1 hypothetical protein AEK19_MT0475 [Utricularia reniformis]